MTRRVVTPPPHPDKPRLISPSDPAVITITTGSRLELNCSAVGQPAPSYAWTHPSDAASFTNTSIYSIKSVTSVDKGLYTCNVSNSMGTVAVNFTVHVQGECYCVFRGHLLMREEAYLAKVFFFFFSPPTRHRQQHWIVLDCHRFRSDFCDLHYWPALIQAVPQTQLYRTFQPHEI